MEKLLPFFPLNAKVKKNDVVSLIIVIAIYIVVAAVLGFIIGLISSIPVVGLIGSILSLLVWIYEVVGIVLAIVTFVK